MTDQTTRTKIDTFTNDILKTVRVSESIDELHDIQNWLKNMYTNLQRVSDEVLHKLIIQQQLENKRMKEELEKLRVENQKTKELKEHMKKFLQQ
jgi:hypothetical protein